MPFVRMAKAVDELAAACGEKVTVQTGHTDYDYRHAKAFKFCTRDEMRQHISEARLLILQGGWGAISEAMELGKRIVVLPRRDKEEHIHDQFQLIRKLDALGCVVGVFDERDLPAAVKKAGVLRVGGTRTSFLFSQLDETDNSLRGFDAGLYQLLAKYILGDETKFELTETW